MNGRNECGRSSRPAGSKMREGVVPAPNADLSEMRSGPRSHAGIRLPPLRNAAFDRTAPYS
jgi:hypothetical protein